MHVLPAIVTHTPRYSLPIDIICQKKKRKKRKKKDPIHLRDNPIFFWMQAEQSVTTQHQSHTVDESLERSFPRGTVPNSIYLGSQWPAISHVSMKTTVTTDCYVECLGNIQAYCGYYCTIYLPKWNVQNAFFDEKKGSETVMCRKSLCFMSSSPDGEWYLISNSHVTKPQASVSLCEIGKIWFHETCQRVLPLSIRVVVVHHRKCLQNGFK